MWKKRPFLKKPGPTEETENPGPAGTETDSEHAFPTPGV